MMIRQLILRNFWLKALSFVIAVLIWLVVQTQITGGNLQLAFQPQSSDTRVYQLQLHLLKTANDGRMIHIEPDSVTVTVHGDKTRIGRLEATDLRAYVDLAGTRLLPPNDQVLVRVDLPDGIDLVEVRPSKVSAEIVSSSSP